MLVKSIKVVFLFLLVFSATVSAECKPPGEREYHKEWLITEGQSLLHKCALGGLVNFGVLSIFDPSQMILGIIKAKACSFVRQKTQPFRDDLNAEVNKINAQIRAGNAFQSKGAWEERVGSVWKVGSKDKFGNIRPGKITGSNFYGDSIEIDTGVAETVFNNGQSFNNEGEVTPLPQGVYSLPESAVDDSTKGGLLDRGADTGLDSFPLPTPKEWGDVYNGTIN